MKKSELYVIVFMLCFCAFFAYETLQLPIAAQRYPLFVIGMLGVLTIIKFINMFLASAQSKRVVDDSSKVWEGFLSKQFFTVFIASVVFFVLMYFIGFYLASLLYLAYSLHYFKIPVKYSAITIVAMLVIVYAVFTEFLNVPLPMGELLEDLI